MGARGSRLSEDQVGLLEVLDDHDDVHRVDEEIATIEHEKAEYIRQTAELERGWMDDLAHWSNVELPEALKAGKQPRAKPRTPIEQDYKWRMIHGFDHRIRQPKNKRQETIARLSQLMEQHAESEVERLTKHARGLLGELASISDDLNRLNSDLHAVRMARFTIDVTTGPGAPRPDQPPRLTGASLADAIEHKRPLWQPRPRSLGFVTPIQGDVKWPETADRPLLR